MRGRIGSCILVAVLTLLAEPAAAQQTPKAADPKGAPPPSGAGKTAAPAKQKPNPTPTIAVPAPEVLLVLVRSALIALDHANRTGNYTVLRELGGPGLQRHSSAQLGGIFASLRNQQVDLLPVAIVTPQLTRPPSVSPEGLLQLVGFFPTQPRQIQFQIVYQPVDGQWRLFGLNVTVTAAQQPPPQASAAPAPRPKEAQTAQPVAAPPPKKK
jgi:hypothetical protein